MYKHLTSIYEKSFFEEYSGGCQVLIDGQDSEYVKSACFIAHSKRVVSIDPKILKEVHCIYKKNDDKPKMRHECDGIYIVDDENKKYIVFVELKSKHTEANFKKAELQIAISCVRVVSRLDNFRDFDARKYNFVGIIVSQKLLSQTFFKYKSKKETKQNSRYEKNALMQYKNKDAFYELLPFDVGLSKLDLKENILFSRLPIFNVTAIGKEKNNIDLYRLLKKL